MPLQPSRIADTLNRGTSCRVVVNYDATMMNLAASIKASPSPQTLLCASGLSLRSDNLDSVSELYSEDDFLQL